MFRHSLAVASLLAIAGLSLAGCGGVRRADSEAARLQNSAETRLASASDIGQADDLIRHANTPYLGEVRSRERPPPKLPAAVETEGGFSLRTGISLTPAEAARRIAQATKIPTVVLINPLMRVSSEAVAEQQAPIFYAGPLSGFLDQMCAYWDTAWEYDSGVIRIHNTVTTIYEIRASVATSEFSLQTTNTSPNTGSVSTDMRIQTSLWAEVRSALADQVQPGRFDMAPGTGLVSVTAPPSVHRKVDAYISRANRIFDSRILIDIVAAFIDVAGLDDYGISFELLRNASHGNSAITLGRPHLSTEGGFASFRVTNGASGRAGQYPGSQLLLHALSRSNRLVDYRTASAITRHGSPVPIRMARKQDIVRSVEIIATETSRTTSIESETLDTGLSLSAYPRILNQDRVHLTLALVASDLVNLTSFTTGGDSSVQLATVDERRLTHDLVLLPGETLLLAGYEQEQAKVERTGVGSPNFPLLGGGGIGKTARTRLFLIVSARIL